VLIVIIVHPSRHFPAFCSHLAELVTSGLNECARAWYLLLLHSAEIKGKKEGVKPPGDPGAEAGRVSSTRTPKFSESID